LGRHRRKRTQFSISNRLPSAAAPALIGVAAAITLSASMTPSPALASTLTPHIASAGQSWRVANAQLLAAIHPIARKPATAHKTARRYTVRPGDTLSTIAGKVYHDPGAWPVLYWANRDKIRWANSVDAGEVLTVPVKPARIPAAPAQLGPAPAPAPAPAPELASTDQSDAGQSASAGGSQPEQSASTYTGSSSFQDCVIASESGGNSQVMNSSGHYGLYQFSSSTWAEYGGNPADFGDASVAEQNQVFDNAIAAGGQSNWSAYDGC
jgi:Transglycosylase-like domain/LysM domain